jgi:peptidoglycan-associated lipoprotein
MHIVLRVLPIAVLIASVGLSACSSQTSSGKIRRTPKSEERVVADTLATPRKPPADVAKEPGPVPVPLTAAQQGAMAALRDPVDGLVDVFFPLDRATLTREAYETVRRNGYLLRSTTAWELEIQGHCDERGSSAYNMVLGERRAKAVREALADIGIPAERIEVSSYGEERPFCTERTERCYEKNRRAHFVIRDGRDGRVSTR